MLIDTGDMHQIQSAAIAPPPRNGWQWLAATRQTAATAFYADSHAKTAVRNIEFAMPAKTADPLTRMRTNYAPERSLH